MQRPPQPGNILVLELSEMFNICSVQTSKVIVFYCLLAVTIYVKKEEEKVYNALMLDSFGVVDLREAVSILCVVMYYNPSIDEFKVLQIKNSKCGTYGKLHARKVL